MFLKIVQKYRKEEKQSPLPDKTSEQLFSMEKFSQRVMNTLLQKLIGKTTMWCSVEVEKDKRIEWENQWQDKKHNKCVWRTQVISFSSNNSKNHYEFKTSVLFFTGDSSQAKLIKRK